MISVIVYGRNDSHGFNMQKRVSLSLNCMAEVLTHVDDEIIFVDWNSEAALPTLPEAIWDTLTPKCRRILKVVQVPSAVHQRVAPPDLTRPMIEPLARNIAIRRSNEKNLWILSTNTDMVFMPKGQSISDLVSGLEPNYYQSYRFEIPEYLWSAADRLAPGHFISEVGQWLDNYKAVHRIILNVAETEVADAPGDFQLAPRRAWFDVRGFPESMMYGWHVDGAVIGSLVKQLGSPNFISESQLTIAHCNHLRTLTHYHTPGMTMNTIDVPPSSPPDWGMPNHEFHIFNVDESPALKVDKISQPYPLIGGHSEPASPVTFEELSNRLDYDIELATAFLFDRISILFPGDAVGYFGVSDRMFSRLKDVCESRGIHLVRIDGVDSSNPDISHLLRADLSHLVMDLGLPFGEPYDLPRVRKVGKIALAVPSVAAYLRANRNPLPVSFIRAITWCTRETVVRDFQTPLFNNYTMVSTGAVRPKTISSGRIANKGLSLSLRAGVRSLYSMTSPHAPDVIIIRFIRRWTSPGLRRRIARRLGLFS